jgi:hypothetical protein
MQIGDHPQLKPVVARTFLPVASGLFVLPDAGVKASALLGTSVQVAQASALARQQQKVAIHDKLFQAREAISAVASGEIGEADVGRAAETLNAYIDALDAGKSNDRNKAEEVRTVLKAIEPAAGIAGVDVVAGKLVPDASRIARNVDLEPEATSDAFLTIRDRLEKVFVSHSESLSVEAATAQARIPASRTIAAAGARVASLSLKGAQLTQTIRRVDLAAGMTKSQKAQLARLQALAFPRPKVPGTTLPGMPALGRPSGISGGEYFAVRGTPGLAPGKPVVSERRADGVPDWEAPQPVELRTPISPPGTNPKVSADVAKTVREIAEKKKGHELEAALVKPISSLRRRIDPAGNAVPAKILVRPPKVEPRRRSDRLPGPEPVDRADKRRGSPKLAEPTQDTVPVVKEDKIPRNPGKPLKDLLPQNPLPPRNGPGNGQGNGRGNGRGDGIDMPAPPPGN